MLHFSGQAQKRDIFFSCRQSAQSFFIGHRSGSPVRVKAAAQAQSIQQAEETKDNQFPFHLDTAVLLAGFAFEAYNDAEEGIQELSSCGTESIFLNEDFVKELYQGQLKVKLESASDLPGKSLTGTSDPYVVLTVGDSMVRSETMWRDLAPTWNADFSIFVSDASRQLLSVQVFDENVVGSDVLLASGSVPLDGLTDGSEQTLEVDLHTDLDDTKSAEGDSDAAGPKVLLKVRFEKINEDTVLNRTLKAKKEEEEEKVGAKELVEKVSGALRLGKEGEGEKAKLGFSTDLWGSHSERELTEGEDVEDLNDSESDDDDADVEVTSAGKKTSPNAAQNGLKGQRTGSDEKRTGSDGKRAGGGFKASVRTAEKRTGKKKPDGFSTDLWGTHSERELSEEETVEDLNDSEDNDDDDDVSDDEGAPSASVRRKEKRAKVVESARESLLESLSQAAKAGGSLKVPAGRGNGPRLGLGKALLAFATCPCPCCVAELLSDGPNTVRAVPETTVSEKGTSPQNGPENAAEVLALKHLLEVPWRERSGALWNSPKAQKEVIVEKKLEREQNEMARVFADAESAVEAWAVLASSLGKPGYVKSEFEKMVFVDHQGSDTQAAVWRDPRRKRIVVAFRGTEQTEWKDLVTDVNLTPAKFEVDGEEVRGDGEEGDIILHGGFKNAYDSVRSRLRTIVRALSEEPGLPPPGRLDTSTAGAGTGAGARSGGVKKSTGVGVQRGNDTWSLLVTGHSLGGALATLFAAEMAMAAEAEGARIGHVTMYNFGSPRVGNHAFADFYNRRVPDTWRLVNRNDVIPTVPRMLGYCHVGNALILGDKPGAPVEAEEHSTDDPDVAEADAQEDILGEVSAKDFLPKLLKGEKTLLKKVVEKELAILDAFTDGSALLQHMEDFYYKALLQMVELHIGRGVDTPQVAQA
ncbi:hypothetical protein KFL_000680030 [Klebsormidium nitens]|uniref:C2 domain-containing protein n=1 Tax=Klebsormidium nitens TaxID=105231 RepID=A0A0U9HIR2_KLENI|nr:hypothetical protein KFL_000680030 [Klebsormidium nitens]|eukprot:GAQ80987.1 hypothetical protein KFL_000680030 [Klebsormidium nitens]